VHHPAHPVVSTALAHEIATERQAAARRYRAARPPARRPARFAAGLRRRAAGRRSLPAFPAVTH
jgi:hypothetical protein